MGYWIGLENVVCVCLDVLWCGFVVFLNWIESIVLVCRFMLVMEYKWRGVGEGLERVCCVRKLRVESWGR